TEDYFMHDEDTIEARRAKADSSLEAMAALPVPAPRKLLQTEASGISPDLTTASRAEQQLQPPQQQPSPKSSQSNLRAVHGDHNGWL
ncbi:hypothetical protein PENTCL1PPCAC_697, partial [Pristionchus entomophagus]